MWTMRWSRFVCATGLMSWVSLSFTDVTAQSPEPSATRGRALAVRLCANCHMVDGSGKSAPEGIGTFRGIANRPGQSSDRISNTLMLPHMPMPDTQITRDEIQDILAYLEILRTNPDVPPLIAPGTSKRQYPSKT